MIKTLALVAATALAPLGIYAETQTVELGKCAALYDTFDGYMHKVASEGSEFDLPIDFEMRAAVARLRAEQTGQSPDWDGSIFGRDKPESAFIVHQDSLAQCDDQLGFVPNSGGGALSGMFLPLSISRPDNMACVSLMAIAYLHSDESDTLVREAVQEHANSMSAPLEAAGWTEAEADQITLVLIDIFNRRHANEGPVNPHGKLATSETQKSAALACMASWPRRPENAWVAKTANADADAEADH